MNVRIRTALIVAAALAVAYSAAAWLIGLNVETQLLRDEQRLLAATPYLRLVRREYHRGVYSAMEELTYGPGASLAPVLRGTSSGQALLSLQLTVHNTIYHGPLPGLRIVAFATVDSQLQLPATLQRQLQAMLAGAPIVQVHTTMGWLGGGTAAVSSPAFDYRAPDGTVFGWRGITGTIATDRALRAWSTNLAAPGFSLQSTKARVQFANLRFSASMRRVFDALYIGNTDLTLARLEFQPTTGNTLALQGVSFKGASSANGQYVDEGAELAADSIQAAQFSATRVGYAVRVEHLHGPSLAALTQALRQMQRDAPGSAATPGRVLEAFRQYGVGLVSREPVLRIERIGFVMPEGELRLSGKLTLPGLVPADLQGPAALVALRQHLAADVDLRADSTLVAKLLESSSRRDLLMAQIEQLESQGYLKRDGTALTAHLVYQSGKLSINDRPYP